MSRDCVNAKFDDDGSQTRKYTGRDGHQYQAFLDGRDTDIRKNWDIEIWDNKDGGFRKTTNQEWQNGMKEMLHLPVCRIGE